MSARPLLLLDFDGPLNPYRAKTMPAGYRRHEIVEGAKIWSVLLNQQHGVELNALADVFQLVWATSWEHGANRLLAPLLGLPDDLPVIVWPDGARDAAPSRRPQSWKTPYVAGWVGSGPFVWLDDEVDRHDRAYLSAVAGIGPQNPLRARDLRSHPGGSEHLLGGAARTGRAAPRRGLRHAGTPGGP